MSYALGVDLGTTYSAAAVAEDGHVEIFTLGTVAPAIPSVVVLRADGEVLVGEAAERRAVTEPTRTAREFKRRLGDPAPFVLGGTPYGAESLMAHLLREIVGAVTARQGRPPRRIVVTHPANYGPYKRDLLAEMVRLADVGPVEFLTEPEAAAIAYARQNRLEPGDVVAVYDFGGGTFDAAVLRKTPDGFELLGQPEGMERLGGIDFDQAVFAHVDDAVGGQIGETDASEPMARAALARLRADVRSAKESLSTDTDVTIPVLLPGLQTDVRLTRPEFEAMVRPRIAESIAALERAVRNAGLQMADVSRVLLVGGTSRIPLVGEMVRQTTGRPVAVDAHPKFAIALGAAQVGDAEIATERTAMPVAETRAVQTVETVAAISGPDVTAGTPVRTAVEMGDGRPHGRKRMPVRIAALGLIGLVLVGATVVFAMRDRSGTSPYADPSVYEYFANKLRNGTATAPPASRPPARDETTQTPAGDLLVAPFAGIDSPGDSGDGGPAVAAQLGRVGGLAVGPDGAVYISDYGNGNVRVVRDGIIETLADGLGLPQGLDVAPDGSVFVADSGNHRIVRIAPDRQLFIVAGGSDVTYGFDGDGGPAGLARMYQPSDVDLDGANNIIIADFGNDRIRLVDPRGTIWTIAGTGAKGFYGDGGPAAAAQLERPQAVVAVPDGSLLIADRANHRIRRVIADGTISTMAGISDERFTPPTDGAPAAKTSFYDVSDLALDGAGRVYANPARIIARISGDGRVEMVAGGGSKDEDGLPAREVGFGEIWAIAVDPQTGTLYVGSGSRVRAIPGAGAGG